MVYLRLHSERTILLNLKKNTGGGGGGGGGRGRGIPPDPLAAFVPSAPITPLLPKNLDPSPVSGIHFTSVSTIFDFIL